MVDSAASDQASEPLDPSAEELYWQRAFITEPYYNKDLTYDDYGPAYRAGIKDRMSNGTRSWDEAENSLQTEWERSKGASRLSWEDAQHATRAAWYRTDNALSGSDLFGIN